MRQSLPSLQKSADPFPINSSLACLRASETNVGRGSVPAWRYPSPASASATAPGARAPQHTAALGGESSKLGSQGRAPGFDAVGEGPSRTVIKYSSPKSSERKQVAGGNLGFDV